MDRTVYISNDIVSLVEYQTCDDRALYENWQDPDVQKGYNGIFFTTFEEFEKRYSKRSRFFAIIQLNGTSDIIGSVGVSPPETIPDLSIWIFKPYRRRGYGTAAFALAAQYAVETLGIAELHAGAYPDNTGSQKMLLRCGYIPYPAGNIPEKHYITGEDIIQMDYIYRLVTIRLATPADAADMAEVHMRSWEVAYCDIIPAEYIREKNATRLALWQRVVTDDNTARYVIQAGGKTVGLMHVDTSRDDDADDSVYELHGLYLHPDVYRQGIGTRAMAFAFDIARGLGKKVMTVWVLADNANSIKFYEKCGFAADGKTQTHNFGKELQSIRMRRRLSC